MRQCQARRPRRAMETTIVMTMQIRRAEEIEVGDLRGRSWDCILGSRWNGLIWCF